MKKMWRSMAVLFFFLALPFWGVTSNTVTLREVSGRWRVFLNGKKFQIRGVGVGYQYGKTGIDYLKMAKQLGANVVRTWGVDQGTKEYLDTAHKYKLKVCAGIWLNSVSASGQNSYITDNEYQKKVWKQAISYVKRFRNHPSVLFWNLGNEVFIFTKHSEEERIAFAKFLNRLAKAIKKIDPKHPIVYTSAALTGHPYIVRYTPSIDILGMNLYGGVPMAIFNAENNKVDGKKLNRPILVTEVGPNGSWDLPKDETGLAAEPPDHVKASQLRYRVKFLLRSRAIGAFAFHLGETTQDSFTWWNMNFKQWHLQQFRSVRSLYKKTRKGMWGPKIDSIVANKRIGLRKGQWIDVTVVADPSKKGKQLRYTYFCSSSRVGVLLYYVNHIVPIKVKGVGPQVRIKVPAEEGSYRIYVLVTEGEKNGAIANLRISVK